MDDNINTLNEVNKGANMGMDSINFLINKVKDDDFKMILLEEYFDYEVISDKANKIYKKYNHGIPQTTNLFNKLMLFMGINMRLMKDSTDSKIAQLLMQGTNMGIIEGRRLINNKNVDKKINKLLNIFVSMQEKNVETLKKYL